MSRFARLVVVLLSLALPALAMHSPPVLTTPAGADDSQTLQSLLREFVLSEFVEITPGKGKFPASFRMGSTEGPPSERPVHEVQFAYGFRMAKGEVAQNLYSAVMGNNPSRWKGARNSVEMMPCADALEFCRRLTRLLRESKLIADDDEIRLPTEAEWEYCCRAGTTTAYSFGDSATRSSDTGKKASLLDEFGWHTGNAEGNDPPVGAKKPNAWGLYDMHGYLWEFVADAWHPSFEGAPSDGRAWTQGGTRHVVRGGSWKDRFEHHTSASRRPIDDEAVDDAVGFRCVLAKGPPR